jgi:putative drug exporter of the RND superfamily
VACGTTGAPRTGQAPLTDGRVPLTDGRVPRADGQAPQADGSRGGRLAGFVTGRRTKYLVVVCWLVLAAVTASLARPAAQRRVSMPAVPAVNTTLLYATLAVVIVLLVLTYRSPVLWLLPIVSAGVALTVAEAVIHLLDRDANQNGSILVVLVIGASTDYAVLLMARYREELRRHADRHVAMAVALRRAGPAIIASGLAIVAGMLCLLAAESNDIARLGPVTAIGIAAGLIAMVTLLPALLVVSGRWT